MLSFQGSSLAAAGRDVEMREATADGRAKPRGAKGTASDGGKESAMERKGEGVRGFLSSFPFSFLFGRKEHH